MGLNSGRTVWWQSAELSGTSLCFLLFMTFSSPSPSPVPFLRGSLLPNSKPWFHFRVLPHLSRLYLFVSLPWKQHPFLPLSSLGNSAVYTHIFIHASVGVCLGCSMLWINKRGCSLYIFQRSKVPGLAEMILFYVGQEDAFIYLLCTKTGSGCVPLDFSVTVTEFHSMDNF